MSVSVRLSIVCALTAAQVALAGAAPAAMTAAVDAFGGLEHAMEPVAEIGARVVGVRLVGGELGESGTFTPRQHLVGDQQGRQRARNALEQWRRALCAVGLLRGLDLIPPLQHVLRRLRVAVAEYMRMPADHLAVDRLNRIGHVEVPGLGRHLRKEYDLQQQVAQIGRAHV